MTNDNDASGALTDEQLGHFLLPLMRKHLSPVAIDHLSLGDEPTIGMRKLARALLTEARSDGFRDCIDAIRGAIEFGKQDVNHAPTEHWLAEFWDIGRRLAAPSLPAGDGLTNIQNALVIAANAAGKMAISIQRGEHSLHRHEFEQLAAAEQKIYDALNACDAILAAPRQPGEMGAGVPDGDSPFCQSCGSAECPRHGCIAEPVAIPRAMTERVLRAMAGWREIDANEELRGEAQMLERIYSAIVREFNAPRQPTGSTWDDEFEREWQRIGVGGDPVKHHCERFYMAAISRKDFLESLERSFPTTSAQQDERVKEDRRTISNTFWNPTEAVQQDEREALLSRIADLEKDRDNWRDYVESGRAADAILAGQQVQADAGAVAWRTGEIVWAVEEDAKRHAHWNKLTVEPLYTRPAAESDKSGDPWTDLLAYVLQDDLHNRLTPRVIDIAYTAFMKAFEKNKDDGGPTDWYNDTRPVVLEAIEKLRKDLYAARAAMSREQSGGQS